MTRSAFVDHDHAPTDQEIRAVLGEAVAGVWTELAATLERDFGARWQHRWDGPRSGWSVAYRRAGRPFVTLTPEAGAIGALVVLGRTEAEAAGGLPLGEQVRDLFASSEQLHDGRWLFLTIATHDDLEDLLRLLTVKLPARVRAKLALARPPVPA
jgi:hypothetical protein